MRARERDPSILHCCTEVSTRNRMPGKCCLNQNFASLCEKKPLMLTGSELRICLFPQRRQVQKKSAGKPALIFCRVTGEHLLKLAATLAIPGVSSTPLTSHRQNSDNSLPTTFSSPEAQHGSSWKTQRRAALPSFWEVLRPLSGGERLLLASTNQLLSTSPLEALVLGGCRDRAPASAVPAQEIIP